MADKPAPVPEFTVKEKKTLDNTPVSYPPSSSSGKNSLQRPRGDKRFSLFSSIAAARGDYVDGKGVRWDTNNADFEGFLNKKSRWIGEWRKRYFILKGNKLFFAKSATTTPHGMIDLADYMSVQSVDLSPKISNAFLIKLTRGQFTLAAFTEPDKYEWITQISRILVQTSATFIGPKHEFDDLEEVNLSDGSDD